MIILFKIKLALSIHLLNMSGTLDINSRSLTKEFRIEGGNSKTKDDNRTRIDIMIAL